MRRRTSRRDEIEGILKEGKRLGRTYAEIAAEAGVARSTLARWAWRLRREKSNDDRSEEKFVELVTAPREEEARFVEVALRCGHLLRAPLDVDGRRLAELVAALETC